MKKTIAKILSVSIVAITVISLVIQINGAVKTKEFKKDLLTLNTNIVDIVNGSDSKDYQKSEILTKEAKEDIEGVQNDFKTKYPNYINMSAKQEILENESGTVESMGDADENYPVNVEMTEEELKAILGDDYKERADSDIEEEQPVDDARLKLNEDGDHVLYHKDIVWNDNKYDYVDYKGSTFLITSKDMNTSYLDLIGTQDLNFILVDSKEYSNVNTSYIDMYFMSVTNKYKLKIRYFTKDRLITKVEVRLIEE